MSEHFAFKGRTAVITGAASGIGAALADALADRGCNLILADINADGLAMVAERVARPFQTVTSRVLDIADGEAIKAFAAEVGESGTPVHLLFNNAGVALGGTFDQVSESDFDWLMDINFYGVVRMTRAFLPLMQRADQAQLVNVSSIFGIIAPPGQTAYSAAKFAVRGFSAALRHELDGTSVGVTTVHPGGIATSIADSARMPAGTGEAEVEERRDWARRALVLPPEEAARIILKGVERRRPRVLVGRDAHAIAIIERLNPVNYWKMIEGQLRPKS